MEAISNAKLTQIFFRKDDFLIGKFSADDRAFSAKGTVFEPQIGLSYDLEGEWETHDQYGRQFAIDTALGREPESHSAVVNYLIDHAPWVGRPTAEKIVETFGGDALQVCKQDPTKVVEKVPGITAERAEEMAAALNKRSSLERTELEIRRLLGQFVTKSAIGRIRSRYGREAKRKILENPYRLVYEIEGIGFLTADQIAKHLGYGHEDPRRVEAGIYHILYENAWSHGHVCIPYGDAVRLTAALLAVPTETVDSRVVAMGTEEKPLAVFEEGFLYLQNLRRAELNVAERLSALLQAEPRSRVWTADDHRASFLAARQAAEQEGVEVELTDESIEAALPQSHKMLKDDQVEALEKAQQSTVFILTGAPGTGKTTCLKAIIESFGPDALIGLCAPSGKAAKRMAEQTDMCAMTIHRFLEAMPTDEGGFRFGRDRTTPLIEDVIIVDEVSMVDISLMSHLMDAIKDGARVILVGDFYQLPSVGPGNVLKDLIESEVIPTVELTIIKRQDPGLIVQNCHRIKDGQDILVDNDGSPDFRFYEEDDPRKIQSIIVQLASETVPAIWNDDPAFDRVRDIQVITALREKTELSCKALNGVLQARLNPGETGKGCQFREGDKVIQLKNRSVQDRRDGKQHSVVNGDIGYVEENIPRPACAVVKFENPDRQIGVARKSVDRDLAYALTVHKFQGSESRVVIIPVHKAFGPFMLQRTWIYTAISRAADLCILVGQRGAVAEAIRRNHSIARYSLLKKRIQENATAEART